MEYDAGPKKKTDSEKFCSKKNVKQPVFNNNKMNKK